MIIAKLFKMQGAGWACDNPTCQHDEKYHDHILGVNSFIKEDTICLSISVAGSREVYCRDCINVIYQKLKPVLDSKLWTFR